ncbi:PLP-dependent aminotransferase family protein [Actinomadura craniellae]|uniref:PLP-dependent aminotransferase family protein n=1 Tax=Actinomadura craniellae TaxID=2231787 RepID=A0A365H5L1_9ACTN|nr:PLP-dependent aminotransferase family protein [Actinomadura craniellae]RAY14381.1 PLP-dependent aminotransferase family protein [Actinomadura craniellae]
MRDLHLPLDRAAGGLSSQIASGLRSAVRSGRLTAGTRLPSSRDLARALGVSRGVAVTAYEQLVAEGFLVSRRGDGTRVAPLARPDGPPEPARTPSGGVTAAYDLRPGPDLSAFPRERWQAALRAALRALPHGTLDYPDPAGAGALRAELAGYLGRVRAAVADPGRLMVVNGVAHALAIIVRLLAEDGRGALAVEDPTSDRQLPTLRRAGADPVRVPVDGAGIDVAALARTGARAVLVTPAHQYPTGVVLSPRRRAELIGWARAVDGLVLEDDYDAEFRYDREPVGCVQALDPDRVVLLGSVSKALAPALRLGWALAPAPLAGRIRRYREETDLGTAVIEQHALAHLLATGGYDRHLRAMRRSYRSRRDALARALRAELPAATVHGVSAGLHLYVELPPGHGEAAAVAAAARAGVAVVGAAPMWSRPAPSAALVLGYARMGEARLADAVKILARAITPRDDG